jgi:hypothetical protein
MTDLTDKMRTCAAYLCGEAKAGDGSLRDFGRAIIDAAALLNEAADLLEAYRFGDSGEPMEIIPPMKPIWASAGDTLPVANPSRTPHTCPNCDSRATKTVLRSGNKLVLVCPVCAVQWEYVR